MSIYQATNLGSNLSQFAVNDDAQDQAIMAHQRGTTTPVVAPLGSFWHRTNHPTFGECIQVLMGTGWQELLDPEHMALNAGGTVPLEADLDAGGFKIIDLDPATQAGEAATYDQVLLLDGSNPMAADMDMGGFRITNLDAPVDDNDAARKVDLAGVRFFRTTGGGSDRIDSGPLPTTTTFIERINETPFVPEKVIITIKGNLRDANDLDQIDAHATLSAIIPRWRHETSNGGIFEWVAGHIAGATATGGVTTFQTLRGEFNNANTGSPPTGWDWMSQSIAGEGGRNWRLFVKFHTSGTLGVSFWLRRADETDYVDIDEVGGGAEGVVQIMVFGGGA